MSIFSKKAEGTVKKAISVEKRLVALIAVGTVAVLSLGVLSIVLMNRLSAETARVNEINQNVVVPVDEIRLAQLESLLALDQIALAGSDRLRDEWLEKMREQDAIAAEARARATERIGTASASYDDFLVAYDKYLEVRDAQLLPILEMKTNSEKFGEYLRSDLIQDQIDIYEIHLAGVYEQVNEILAQAEADSNRLVGQSSYFIVALLLVVGGVFVGIGIQVIRGVRAAVKAIRVSIDGMAEGDLTVEAKVLTTDELGVIATQMNVARESITQILHGVRENSVTVAASAQELGASGSQVASGAEESSAQAGQVAAASEQVSLSVQTVAAGAEEMGASIREIASNAAEAARVAVRATSVAAATNETVAKLGDSSREIGAVVRTINSIAEQTNLLALNATIEAARAGEAGKGFAVVAGEVKELAGETARATEDISRRVEAIQVDAVSAVEAITEISEIIATINDYQGTIASSVEEQTATTSEMSRSVSEAAAGVEQITINISGVAAAASQNSATVTQMSTAIAELAHISSDLQLKVDTFRF